jgi:hypothetical protein
MALSIGRVEDGLLHTVSAGGRFAAMLDAIQYIDGGPAPMAVRYGTRIEARLNGGSDAAGWGALGAAGRAVGVRSVLSIPVVINSAVCGALTIHADDADAFDRHLNTLNGLGALTAKTVMHAEEPLRHRNATALRPEPARDQNAIDWAVCLVVAWSNTEAAAATDLFRRAATRCGLSDSALAHQLALCLTTP